MARRAKAPPRPAEVDAMVLGYLPSIKRLACVMERRHQNRDDLVSETVTRLLERHDGFRPDGSFHRWVYWTMRGVLADKKWRSREVEDPTGIHGMRLCVPANQEHATYLGEVMTRLPAEHRTLVERRAQQWTQREMAKAEGVTPQAICWRAKYAKDALKKVA